MDILPSYLFQTPGPPVLTKAGPSAPTLSGVGEPVIRTATAELRRKMISPCVRGEKAIFPQPTVYMATFLCQEFFLLSFF